MPLPTPLSHRNKKAYKNQFGHVFVLAGSYRMLGAAALSSLAAMRTGTGLVTCGVPKSLNSALHKKLSSVIMTRPLNETKEGTFSTTAFPALKNKFCDYTALAVGPGLTTHPSTAKLVVKIMEQAPLPMVIDADALNILAKNLPALRKTSAPKVLTPHLGEMARLTQTPKTVLEKNKQSIIKNFAQKYQCTILLKGHQSLVCSPHGKIYKNTTGNAGMATAGSGDVLTGMLASLLGQGWEAFTAAKTACYLHGLAGDLAAKKLTQPGMIATDIISFIPDAIKKGKKRT